MSMPVCPNCGSTAVVPSQWSAGQNACRSCGHTAAVASFHEERKPTDLKPGRYSRGTAPPTPRTYRAASKPGARHPQQQPKDTENFWWNDI